VQNVMTLLKVVALLIVSGLLLFVGNGLEEARLTSSSVETLSFTAMGAAMVGVLWAYEGWHYSTFSAGETIDAQRTFPRAIIVGTAALVGIYVLVNIAYIAALGLQRGAQSERIAVEAIEVILGARAGGLIALIILISIFSSANGGVLTATRAYFAMAQDGVFFRKMAEIHPRWKTPTFAIVASCIWAAALAATGTFEELLTYVVFAGWTFYALAAASIFWYRRREPQAIRPFVTPGYPWTPILFIIAAASIVLNTVFVHPGRAMIGAGLVMLGAPAFWLWKRQRSEPSCMGEETSDG
jgi:APA family basic amino acid/polyamine antiporter